MFHWKQYYGKKLKKQGKKGIERSNKKKEYTKQQFELFEQHWNSKPHICESCSTPIYGENLSIYHDHLLEKSKWEEFALDIRNLFLCCLQCHSLKTDGHPTSKHKEAIEKAKKELLNEDRAEYIIP